MLFLRDDRNIIWEKGNFQISGIVRDGKYLVASGREIQKLYSAEELFGKRGTELVKARYKVERCAPFFANAVIRVYTESGWKHDDSTHWCQGVDIYLKNWGTFVNSNQNKINYKVYEIKWMFYPDDMPVTTPEFVDFYVRIRKV